MADGPGRTPGSSPEPELDLSIVVVSWNVRDDLEECLKSIWSSLEDPSAVQLEVIVVDNASTDGSAEMVRTRFPQVRVIENDRNEGFSRGNNRAFPSCRGRYVLLLNPDCVLVRGTLEQCLGYLRSHPEAGMLGCRLIHPDGRVQTESARRLPTLTGLFLESMYIELLAPGSPILNRSLIPGLDWNDSGEVPAVTGAFLMIRRDTIDRVGPMDDAVPMYLDDIDWCARSEKAGLPVHYLGSAAVVHKRARSSASLDRARDWIALTTDAKIEFFRKHRGRAAAVACRLILAWGAVFRLLVSLLLWPFKGLLPRTSRAYRSVHPRLHLTQLSHALGQSPRRRWESRPVTPPPAGVEAPVDARLARNTLLNLIGRVGPLFAGLVTIPFLIDALGRDRFGVISLAWILIGYFGLFDLGLGPAVSRYVAQQLAAGNREDIAAVAASAMGVQVVLGTAAALLFAAVTPVLVNDILHIPEALASETRTAFYLLAASIPIVLISGSVRGVLEGAQRFDLVNAVGVPVSISIFVLPLVAAELGWGLGGVAVLLVLSRVAGLVAYGWLAVRVFPWLRTSPWRFSLQQVGALVRFGGWVTVSSVMVPLNLYADRLLIGALLPVGVLAVYTPASEVVLRMELVPGALVAALFPALSALGSQQTADLERLFARSIRALALLTWPVIAVLFVFAPELLRLWLGESIARSGTPVFRILLAGELFGILAPVPGTVLWARGRPDLTAKAYLVYIVPNLLLMWTFVEAWGLKGGAMVFSIVSIIDAAVLTVLALRTAKIPATRFLGEIDPVRTLTILVGFGAVLAVVRLGPPWLQVTGTLVAFGLFAAGAWRAILNDSDRALVRGMLRRGNKAVEAGVDA